MKKRSVLIVLNLNKNECVNIFLNITIINNLTNY